MFSIVQTLNSDGDAEVSVVSNKWIKNDRVSWPPRKCYSKSLTKHEEPQDEWPNFKFDMLDSNISKIFLYIYFILIYLKV